MEDPVRLSYAVEKKGKNKSIAKFRDVFSAGFVPAGTTLVSTSRNFPGEATVTEDGRILIENGEVFDSPSWAAKRHVALHGGAGARNGWGFWSMNGEPLDKKRREFVAQKYGDGVNDNKISRITYWEGFYEYCSNRPDIVELFGDLAERVPNKDWWASFGLNVARCHLDASISIFDKKIYAGIYCADLETYKLFLDNRNRIEGILEEYAAEVRWDEIEENKKSRTLQANRMFDFETADSWEEAYQWQADWLKRLRAVVRSVLK